MLAHGEVGAKILESFVEIAQNKAADAGVDIEFRQGDGALMPFEAGSYDFIVCMSIAGSALVIPLLGALGALISNLGWGNV